MSVPTVRHKVLTELVENVARTRARERESTTREDLCTISL